MKVVIVGGVAGGASAAARLRRLAEDAEIILCERGPDVSFANCGLPYYVGGKIEDRKKLLVTTPQLLRERFNLDVRTRTCVESIDRDKKVVHIRDIENDRTYEERYDKLILSPGASPLKPPIPGIDQPGVYTLRNLEDVDKIKASVNSKVQEAVVVGAGFIGLEMVENLVSLGIKVTLVELQNQLMPPLDQEMTTPMLKSLDDHGVQVLLGDSVVGFEANSDGIQVQLKSGGQVQAQLVSLGIGVRPENKLAIDAGLEVGERGGIRVNDSMQTSDPDIYAVGDAVETTDFVLGGPAQIPLAGPANRQGRIAADHVCGRESIYRGSQGTAILGLFGLTAAMTGSSEKILQRAGRAYDKVYIHPNNHAGYYPGAEQMTLKLIFEPETGKILGAQGIGGAGVDKRIDVIATAIQGSMTVFDLEEIELAYAPQFGSAKDPVNMLGFVASGLVRGDHPQMDFGTFLALEEKDRPFLLDVRSEGEFSRVHVPGAINISVDHLRDRLSELPKDQEIAAYCQVGMRGYIATRILIQSGFKVKNLSGGYKAYLMFQPE